MIILTKQEAEIVIEVLNEFPQAIKWTIQGVNLAKLRERLIEQTREKANANS